MNLTHTISVLELLRFCVGVCGTAFLAFGVLDSFKDLVIVWRSGQNGLREYAAKTTVWLSVALLITQLTIIAYVIIAMTQPSRMTSSPQIIATTTLSLFISLVVVTIGFFTYYRKKELITMILHRESLDAEKSGRRSTDKVI